MPDQPKGTAAAVIIIMRSNPKLNNKEVAFLLRVSVRRVQQITQKFAQPVSRMTYSE